MNCPTCQSEMFEGVSAWECPKAFDTNLSLVHRCRQEPICKGCLEVQVSTGAPIWEYYCDNKKCPRKPEENLRDLFDPRFQRYSILDFTNGENQKTITSWTNVCFPEWSGKKGRALAIIEEAVELSLAAGLTVEEIQSAVNLPIGKEMKRRQDPTYVPEGVEGEIADTLLNVLAFAEEVKVDAHAALNAKMKINRSRPKEFYHAKTKLKKELGLIL